MKNLNYFNIIQNNDDALKTLKFLMILSLLPDQDMETGFLLIMAFARNHNVHLDRLFNYYQRY